MRDSQLVIRTCIKSLENIHSTKPAEAENTSDYHALLCPNCPFKNNKSWNSTLGRGDIILVPEVEAVVVIVIAAVVIIVAMWDCGSSVTRRKDIANFGILVLVYIYLVMEETFNKINLKEILPLSHYNCYI